jgi:signal transduction histidine kinase
VELREELPEGLPKLRADADRLRAVVLNLVRNALLAMPEGGTLTVRTRIADRILVVEVVDTGVGIAPEDQRRVFEPLYSTRERGTGLGLAIARRIAEEHGGAIELESALGRGSTFRVLLPLDAPPPSGGESG